MDLEDFEWCIDEMLNLDKIQEVAWDLYKTEPGPGAWKYYVHSRALRRKK